MLYAEFFSFLPSMGEREGEGGGLFMFCALTGECVVDDEEEEQAYW